MNSQTIIFFDGVCHLCNGFVDLLIRLDRKHKLKFAPLQGTTAAQVLSAQDRSSLESVILWDQQKTYYQSSAILQIFRRLGGPFSLLIIFQLIPKAWRNGLYTKIAANRYQWFGTREFCRLPTSEEKEYLLP